MAYKMTTKNKVEWFNNDGVLLKTYYLCKGGCGNVIQEGENYCLSCFEFILSDKRKLRVKKLKRII